METQTMTPQNVQPDENSVAESQKRKLFLPIADRVAFSLEEVAAMFGKHKSWAYRLVYSGRLKPIKGFGALMISRVEVDKLVSETEAYSGNPARSPRQRRKAEASHAVA